MRIEPKTCPLCGRAISIHGPEEWHPSFYDPDSGGDPYSFECECGLVFSIGSYDYKETVDAWNRRADEKT